MCEQIAYDFRRIQVLPVKNPKNFMVENVKFSRFAFT